MEKYMGLTKQEIEKLLNNFNYYGLDLLSDSVEAMQYEHDEDGTILKEVYTKVKEEKEMTEKPGEKEENIEETLEKLTDKEIIFLTELLEFDPRDILDTMSYYERFEESHIPWFMANEEEFKVPEYGYDIIQKKVTKEKTKRITK